MTEERGHRRGEVAGQRDIGLPHGREKPAAQPRNGPYQAGPRILGFAADDVQVGAERDDGGAGGMQQCFQHP